MEHTLEDLEAGKESDAVEEANNGHIEESEQVLVDAGVIKLKVVHGVAYSEAALIDKITNLTYAEARN